MPVPVTQGRFLTAEWRNLILLNYTVEAAMLRPFVPSGTEVDTFEGRSYISLVGFEFRKTRLLGRSVPFHQAFEEVNLRFYVKREMKRGVVFIRELVPKLAVAAVARFAFRENYSCVPMSHRNRVDAEGCHQVQYGWGRRPERCSMEIETEARSCLPPDGSEAQFIAEHYWGYTAQSGGGCLEYEVKHPPWQVRKAKIASFTGNADVFYGKDFAKVLSRNPDSGFLAEGSEVAVMKGRRIV